MEVALGWLGWTEHDALKTDVNAILLALEGRKAMLRYIFGPETPSPPRPVPGRAPKPASLPAFTPAAFDALFKRAKG